MMNVDQKRLSLLARFCSKAAVTYVAETRNIFRTLVTLVTLLALIGLLATYEDFLYESTKGRKILSRILLISEKEKQSTLKSSTQVR